MKRKISGALCFLGLFWVHPGAAIGSAGVEVNSRTSGNASGPKRALALADPIVLVHGASMGGGELKIGPFSLGPYFQTIPDYLQSLGNEVATPELKHDATIPERAWLLKNYLGARFPNRKVHLIAHSLGGLDARFLVSILGSKQVLSITTIATPHRGSPLADWAIAQREQGTLIYWGLRLFGYDLRERRFLGDIGTEAMAKDFNVRVVDRPDVPIYSVEAWGELGGWSLSPLFYLPYWFGRSVSSSMPWAPNDGLVPLASQSWGKVIGRVELDHLGEINHHPFRPRNHSSLELYRMVLSNLVDAGFSRRKE